MLIGNVKLTEFPVSVMYATTSEEAMHFCSLCFTAALHQLCTVTLSNYWKSTDIWYGEMSQFKDVTRLCAKLKTASQIKSQLQVAVNITKT